MVAAEQVGYNSRSTPYKQFALDKTLGHVLGACMSVARKHGAPCMIGDMTAGPGCDEAGHEGSPLILAKHLNAWMVRGHQLTLICVERDKKRLTALHALLDTRYPDLPVEYFSDQASALARFPTHAVGLTYWDPTRYNNLDANLLAQFGRSHYYMDILITRECLAGYRMQRAAHCPDTRTIQDYLALTGKRRNYILQYADYHWWALGFADNWVDRPEKKFKGFCNVESEEGRKLYSRWTASDETEPEATPAIVQEQTLWER